MKMDMRILGEQSHTGSTPMSLRKDALYGMALLTVAARELADDFARRSIDLRTSVTKVQLFPQLAEHRDIGMPASPGDTRGV